MLYLPFDSELESVRTRNDFENRVINAGRVCALSVWYALHKIRVNKCTAITSLLTLNQWSALRWLIGQPVAVNLE
jgi:hypothetical protein